MHRRRADALTNLLSGAPEETAEYLKDLKLVIDTHLKARISDWGSIEGLWLMPITQKLIGDYIEDSKIAIKHGLTPDELNLRMIELALILFPGIVEKKLQGGLGRIKKILDSRLNDLDIHINEPVLNINNYPSITVHGLMGY